MGMIIMISWSKLPRYVVLCGINEELSRSVMHFAHIVPIKRYFSPLDIRLSRRVYQLFCFQLMHTIK